MDLFRSLVSGNRIRTFNLDLSYITTRVIAMGFPAEGILESSYRNHINDVSAALQEHHGNHFKVINLTFRKYRGDKFGGRVSCLGFDDHHSPPLWLLWKAVIEMHEWVQADPDNVVVVHCMAGKGRTGVVITCYLLYAYTSQALREMLGQQQVRVDPGEAVPAYVEHAELAMKLFATKRSADNVGVEVPSQRRSVCAFSRLLESVDGGGAGGLPDQIAQPRPLQLVAVELTGAEKLAQRSHVLVEQFFGHQHQSRHEEGERCLVWNTAWERTTSFPHGNTFERTSDSVTTNVVPISQTIAGDVLIKLVGSPYDAMGGATAIPQSTLLRAQLHTSSLTVGATDVSCIQGTHLVRVRFAKRCVDKVYNQTSWPDSFSLSLIVEDPSASLVGAWSSCGTCGDSELGSPIHGTVKYGGAVLSGFAGGANGARAESVMGGADAVVDGADAFNKQDALTYLAWLPEPSVQVIHSGWLTKQGGVVKNWKRRWVLVSRDQSGRLCLQYYKNKDDVAPLKEIDVGNYVLTLDIGDSPPQAVEMHPLGVINASIAYACDSVAEVVASTGTTLPTARNVSERGTGEGRVAFSLIHRDAKRSFYFRCNTDEDRQAWLNALRQTESL